MKRVLPQALMAALGDLQESCQDWLIEGREVIARTGHIQRLEEQRAQTISRRAVIIYTQAQDDLDRISRTKREVKSWLAECEATNHQCSDLLMSAEEKQQAAQETLAYWQDELKKTEVWFEWAEERLHQAEVELDAAKAAYESARWNYNDAVDRYNRCVRSEEGQKKGCGSFLHAVERAEARMRQAEYRLRLAIAEYEAAQHEMEHAQARLACCQSSEAFAQKALNIANEAVTRAEQALVEAERSLEYANAALNFVIEAVEYAEKEVAHAETMQNFCSKDRQSVNTAANAHHRADASFESAQRLIILTRHELDYRIARLADFDRTGLL